MRPVDIVIHPCICPDCANLDEPSCYAEAPCEACSGCAEQREAERDKLFDFQCAQGIA